MVIIKITNISIEDCPFDVLIQILKEYLPIIDKYYQIASEYGKEEFAASFKETYNFIEMAYYHLKDEGFIEDSTRNDISIVIKNCDRLAKDGLKIIPIGLN